MLTITKSAPIVHDRSVNTPGPLVRVTVCGADLWFTVSEPKVSGEGNSVTIEGVAVEVGVGDGVVVLVGVAVTIAVWVGVAVVVGVTVTV